MARVKLLSREMSKDFFRFILFFQTVQQYCCSLDTVESHNQAFIQTDNHLTFIVGDVSGIPIEVNPGSNLDFNSKNTEDDSVKLKIRLDPPMLDFHEQPVGMPRMEQVIVQNPDLKNNLHLLSISGSTNHFHCSFFQDKIVPPGGNTTFDVVFLARHVGNVENTLYIHTTQGSFSYQVFGVGIPNPYRLRPYLGARVPINSSFTPLINMHNPHSSTLQVLEMFSSEGDLHLELPGGEKEADKNLWEIPPYETRTVMKASFIGRIENNHTAFIRIKTNKEEENDILVLPMEVEVTSNPGVYSTQELLDFGILRTFDEPKTLQLSLVNTGPKAVQITSVSVSPPNDAIRIEFRPTKLQPEVIRQTVVAQITFRADKALTAKQWSGKIVVKSKNNQHKLYIPYQASVMHGSLVYNVNNTYFFSAKALRNVTRLMTFTNTFNFSIVIYNISLPSSVSEYFSILNFTKPVILQPQETVLPFLLRFHPIATQKHFRTKLVLHTNASAFEIPLIVYNGLLKIVPHRPEKFEGQLDFGTMGVLEKRNMLFTVINDSPVDIAVGEVSTDMRHATIEVLGMEKGNGTTLSRQHNKSQINVNPLTIKPYHFVVLSLNVTAPEEEGVYNAEVVIITQFQDIFMPLMLRTAEGSLNAIPEKIVFERVYPGKIPYKVLQLHSTFEDLMEVTKVAFQPPDERFYFERPASERILLQPHANNVIGRIYFDAKRDCTEECYVGLPTFTPAGHQWLLGLGLGREVADTDQYLYSFLQQRWEKLEKAELTIANVTLELDTNQVQGFLFSAQAHLHWPSLIRRWKIKFPLTQIGNISYSDFIVENPGDVPVLVQVLPLPLYPNPQTIMDMLGRRLNTDFGDTLETDDKDIFILPDLEQFNLRPENPVPGFRKYIENTLGVKPHSDTITTILQPGVKIKVHVGFQPKDDSLRSSLVLIRNNLTIVDAIILYGQGGQGEMKLNNKKPGASPLQFDITEKHLKNCDKRKHSKNVVPNFTVKRSFTLKNTGQLPFYIHGYYINDASCEGYGFRVLDCEGFEMKENTSRKIDIAFTPDFTMSRIRRTLSLHTSLGAPFNFTLQATVPPNTLSKCASALPRPNWEPVLYYSIVCVMGFLLFCILVASYFEADRIFVADILKRKVKINSGTQTFVKEKVFDLKQVGAAQVPNQRPQSPVAEKVSPTLQPNLQHPRPVLEIANGHVEHKSREPFTTTLTGIFKSLFIWKPPSATKKATATTVDRQNSSDKDKKNTAPSLPLKQRTTQETPIEKSIAQKLTKRDKAANKRPQTDLSFYSDNTERKQGNKTIQTGLADRRPAEQNTRYDNNTSKDRTSPSIISATDSAALKNDVTLEDIRLDGKNKGKKKIRTNKVDPRDLMKERQISRESQEDRDEVSSTTTESSTGDGEEKSSSARDSTPEPLPPPKPKKTRNKSRHLDPLIIPTTEDDNDFELASKSKGHKKFKSNSKECGSLELELPYNLKTKTLKGEKDTNSDKSAKKSGKSGKNKSKGDMSQVSSSPAEAGMVVDASHSDDDDSPPPQWDLPIPAVPPSADFSELSIQTESFDQKRAKESGNQSNGFSPEGLTSSSRSSSYSSIVSNSSGEGTNGKNKNGADKRYPVGFTPFTDTGLPVPIKTPVTTKSGAIGSGKLRSAWNTAPGSPTTVESAGTFGLQTIQETSRSGAGLTPIEDHLAPPAFSMGSNSPTNQGSLYAFGAGYDQSYSLTMMQRLQADRRRRIREHQMRVMKGEDWPGFDTPLMRESLWDAEYNPLEPNAWSTTTDSPPTTASGGLWSTLTNSANSGWNSLMSLSSIWGSTSTTSTEPLTTDSSFTTSSGATTVTTQSKDATDPNFRAFTSATGSTPGATDPSFGAFTSAAGSTPGTTGDPSFGAFTSATGSTPGTETVGTFNPFNSMADIWSPQASKSSPTVGWNFPAKSDDSTEN